MNRKKKYILFIIVIFCILIGVIGVIFFCSSKENEYSAKSADEGDVTRYEWMEMLCEQMQITEYDNQTPYFSDVDMDNSYFPYLQSAVKWGLLDSDSDSTFKGDGYASGKFIALTAIKSIGESKLKVYLDDRGAIKNRTYIELAIKHGLIRREQLAKGFSKEECMQVLDNLKDLYFGEFWKDDYSEVIYQKGVIELSPEDISRTDTEGLKITVKKSIADSIDIGTIVVFEQENTKIKLARKVTGISSDGSLSLKMVELDQVVESLTVSDIKELTFEDIVSYYEVEENNYSANILERWQTDEELIDIKYFPMDINSKGFKIALSTEGEEDDRHLEIQVTDNFTKVTKALPINYKIEEDSEDYSAEINIDKILIGGQVSYSVLHGGLEYAEVAVDVESTLKGTVKLENEKKFPLGKTPVPLGNGLVGVDIQLYLVLSAEGNISFEAEIPIGASLYYEKNKGLRNFKYEAVPELPDIEVGCKASVMFRIEPTLVILGVFNVMDIEIDAGATANAKVTVHPTSQVCSEISISFPVITISVGGDDDVDTLIGAMGLSAEWEDILSEDIKVQIGLHYEILPDERTQFVEECTYEDMEEEKENTSSRTVDSNTSKHVYYTRYGEVTQTDSPVFCFEYPDNWRITKEEILGDSTNFGFYAEEFVELSNERDIKITFVKVDRNLFEAGGRGSYYAEYTATKIAKPELALSNINSSDFVVAKLTETGSMITDVDSDFVPADSDYASYALLSESYIDKYGGNLTADGASIGYYEMVSFDYPTPYVFCTESPDGHFTAEEEQEVIDILCSFREAN